MPRQPKYNFRLPQTTIAELDLIARHLRQSTGENVSRSEALRYSAKRVAAWVRKKDDKKA